MSKKDDKNKHIQNTPKATEQGRRKFLTGALGGLAIPVLAGTSFRGYGAGVIASGNTPVQLQSKNNLLKLSLSRADIPLETWEPLSVLGELWDSVLYNKNDREKFQADPSMYLKQKNIDPAVIDSDDANVELLRAVLDPRVSELAIKKDYSGMMAVLENIGVVPTASSSKLQATIEDAMRSNQAQIEEFIEQNTTMDLSSFDAKQLAESDDFQKLTSSLLRGDGTTLKEGGIAQPAFIVAVFLAIAVFVVSYIAVTVGVTTILIVGAAISVGVYVAVAAATGTAVSGGGGGGGFGGGGVGGGGFGGGGVGGGGVGPAPSPCGGEPDCEKVLGFVPVPFAAEAQTLNKLLDVDPDLKKRALQVSRLASIMGNDYIARAAIKEMLEVEIKAIMHAAENVGLLKMGSNAPEVIKQVVRYVEKVTYGSSLVPGEVM
jgi:hypothetical protein